MEHHSGVPVGNYYFQESVRYSTTQPRNTGSQELDREWLQVAIALAPSTTYLHSQSYEKRTGAIQSPVRVR